MLVDDAEDRMVGIHPCEVSAIASPLDPSLWGLWVQCLPSWLWVHHVTVVHFWHLVCAGQHRSRGCDATVEAPDEQPPLLVADGPASEVNPKHSTLRISQTPSASRAVH
jgi:hypothetical protein